MLARCLALSLALLSPAALAEDEPAAAEGAEEAAPAPAPVTYKISASKGLTYVLVPKDPDTVAAGLSHDHAVKSTQHTGSFTWNAADPGSCRLEINLPVSGLEPDLDAVRKAAGLEGTLDEGDRESVKKNMLASDQLDAKKFPTMTFKSKGCAGGDGSFEVSGDLNIHGVSKAVVFKGTIEADDSSFRIKGKLPIKATDFGFEPFTAAFGALKNKNQMTLVIDIGGTAG